MKFSGRLFVSDQQPYDSNRLVLLKLIKLKIMHFVTNIVKLQGLTCVKVAFTNIKMKCSPRSLLPCLK